MAQGLGEREILLPRLSWEKETRKILARQQCSQAGNKSPKPMNNPEMGE